MTCLSHLIEQLEMGLPLSQKYKVEFLKTFGVSFFKPNKQELEQHLDQILGRLHIAKQHKTLNELQKTLLPFLKSVKVGEFFACPDDAFKKIPVVYRAHEELGACYKSVIYTNESWVCGREKEHVFNYNPDDDTEEKMWKYRNSRDIILNMMYKVTHPVKCSLVGIDGSIEDFLSDMELYKSVLSTPIKHILLRVIFYMNTISELVKMHSPDLYKSIADLSALMEAVSEEDSTKDVDEEEANTISHLHSIQVEVITCLNKIVKVVPKEDSVPMKIGLTVRHCKLVQGMTCVVDKIFPECIVIKLGKTLHFRLYKKCVKMNKMSVTDFSTNSNRHMQNNIDKQRRRALDRGDFTDEEDDADYGGDDNNAPPPLPIQQQTILDNRFILFLFFPIKLFSIETIDGTQSASYNFIHVVELTQNMAAEDLIVACTRATDINQLKVFF